MKMGDSREDWGEKSGNLVTSREETTAQGGKQNILAPATPVLQPTEESSGRREHCVSMDTGHQGEANIS